MSHLFILEDIKVAKAWDDSADVLVQQVDDLGAELALGIVWVPLHEEHDVVLLDQLAKSLLQRLLDAPIGDASGKVGNSKRYKFSSRACIGTVEEHLCVFKAPIVKLVRVLDQCRAEIFPLCEADSGMGHRKLFKNFFEPLISFLVAA